MAIGISPEHDELGQAVRRWVGSHCPSPVRRAAIDDDHAGQLPSWWPALAATGWLGLHLGADVGGDGHGISELVVLLDELGHALAGGPVLSTLIASTLIDRWGSAALRSAILPDLADGATTSAVGLEAGGLGAPQRPSRHRRGRPR